jgi:competence protein ComEC
VNGPPFVALGATVAGILLAEYGTAAGSTTMLVMGLGACGAAWFATSGPVRLALVALGLLVVSSVAMTRALEGQRNSPLTGPIARRETATVRGTLVEDPDGPQYTVSALVRVAVDGTTRIVLASATGDDAMVLRVLDAGDRVVVRGRLAPLRTGRFDDRARWQHAVGRLDDARVEDFAPPGGLLAIANPVRTHVLGGLRALPPTQRSLTAGFLLGDTRDIPPEIEGNYRDAGLSHLLAVSGSNVAFVLALFSPLLHRLRLGPRTALALAVVLVFAAMTRFEPSVLRASAMATIGLLASFAGRPAAATRVLAYAAIALLLLDPFLLHSVGFLLSCGASAGIALAHGFFARVIPGPRFVREPLAVSLAAQLGVLPILLWVFGSFPVITPLANLLAAPAAEFLGVWGFVAAIIAGWVPRLGPLLHQPTAFLADWISTVARIGAGVPAHLDVRATFALVAVAAGIASVACRRARDAIPDTEAR